MSRTNPKHDTAWNLFVLGVSQDDIAKRVLCNPKVVQKWSVQEKWVAKREKILDKRIERLGTQVLKEQDSIRGQERAFAEELMAKAQQILDSMTPAKLKKVRTGDLVKMLELASKLSRLSAGMSLGSMSVEQNVRHDLGESIKAAIDKVYGAQAKPIEIAVDKKEIE